MKDKLIELMKQINFDYGEECVCASEDSYKGVPDLAEFFADKLLANGVIVPPCKVGDKLYDITEFVEGRDCPDIYELQDNVLYVEKTKGGSILYSYDGVYIDHDCIGKTVFLTQEEAEKALAERSENEHRTDN